MDPATRTNINPRYEIIKQAAQALNKELTIFSNDSDSDEEDNTTNKNKKSKVDENDDLEQEVLFLRSTLEYFYSHGVFPSDTEAATIDFIATRLIMPLDQFIQDYRRFRKNYKTRVLKICEKFQPLRSIREQDAFELGNRIWGSMSIEMKKRKQQQELQQGGGGGGDGDDQEEITNKEEKGGDGDGDKMMKGIFEKYPVLKRASNFGVKIPAVLKEVSREGRDRLGKGRLEEILMDERSKEVQIEGLKRVVAKIITMKLKAQTLMDELQNSLDD